MKMRLTLLATALLIAGCGSGSSDSSSSAASSSVVSSSESSISSSSSSIGEQPENTFYNPLFSNGADPWLEFYEGNYYLTTTTWNSQLVMRKSPTLEGLATAKPIHVWSDTTPDRCCNFWAFEFHRLQGPDGMRWYLMYSAGIANSLDGQKLRVLESEGDDPMGPYTFKGTPMPNTWNIDGSYLQHDGKLYLLWSEWVGPNQSNWIAELENPWTITGPKRVISTPTHAWERQGANVNEAPAIIQRDGRTFMTFSASTCNGPDYKLGLMELTGSNPLEPSHWTKFPDPVFQQANGVYGSAHNGFFKSPDGTEDWLVYHGNPLPTQGCGDSRAVRAQPFGWNQDGTPHFGEPAGANTPVPIPSGENGPLTASVQGVGYQVVNHNSGQCLGVDGEGNTVQQACESTVGHWVLDSTADGHYRLANSVTGEFLGTGACSLEDGAGANQSPWLNSDCQRWEIGNTRDAWFELTNRHSGLALGVAGCGAESGASVGQVGETADAACREWRLQPVGSVAVLSIVSGKAMEVAGCSVEQGANIHQWEWLGSECQHWAFEHTDSGYYQVRPQHNPAACLVVEGGSTEAGGNLIQGECTGDHAQWRLEPLADGTLRFTPRHNDLALDLDFCRLENGTNLGQWSWLDNDCQRFVLRKGAD